MKLRAFHLRYWPGLLWYRLENRVRRLCGMAPRWRWELCLGCGPFMRCPRCFGNCGFTGELRGGRWCPVCPEVSTAWQQAREFGAIPRRPEFERSAIMAARSAQRAKLEAEGFPFATAEDLRDL